MSNEVPSFRKAVCFIRVQKTVHDSDSFSPPYVQQGLHDLLSKHGWIIEFLSIPYLADAKLNEEISENVILNTTISLRRLGVAGRTAISGLLEMGVVFTEIDKTAIYRLAEIAEESVKNLLMKQVEEIAALEQKLAL